MKCNTCRNLCKRIDDDGTLYDWCGKVIDSPDKDLERDCKYYQPATNADRIRAMSDDELAKYLAWLEDEQACYECELYGDADRITTWLDWLRQEVNK